ncbi:serine/threonine-protein kinase [Nocardia sp. NPDC058176]|uniref:serine/threonine-protein kinase n=1 Tax=Nocardia sp. NPDC058176 TaxID=3346368 RepID=UPI0036D8BFB8
MTSSGGQALRPLGAQEPQRLGRYRLLAVIGRGGMGQVLLGQGPDGRLVAVKQIHRQFTGNPEFRARFRREVLASQQVTGAYTAGVVDHDAESETPWLASEYIAGPALEEMVAEFGKLTVSGLKLLATGLAMALLEIHRTGLVHRDLKPSNVLLTNEGPRVIDFGIARAIEDDVTLTATGTVLGSPAYMSPEQAECRPLTPASDVFAVGAVLAMAATGVSPFAAASTPQVLYNVLYTEPDTTGVPQPIRALVEACLAKDPAARPTPAQLLDAADRIEVEPVWPARIRRRIADRQAESALWAQGRAAVAPVPVERPDRRWARVLTAAGVVSALVLAGTVIWGFGIEGNAVAMEDPPLALTDEETRRLDLCGLLMPSVLGELGTPVSDVVPSILDSCTATYRDPAGTKISFSLTKTTAEREELTGTTIGWLPVLGKEYDWLSCDRAVLTQSGLPIVLEINASVSDGNGCLVAERALAAVVRRLTVNPPLRATAPDSVLLLDPCALIDLPVTRSVVGDVAMARGPHMCRVAGHDGYFEIRVEDNTRPDHQAYGRFRPTRPVGAHTVYVDRDDSTMCEFIVLVRPTRANQAEQLRAAYVSDDPAPRGLCDAATTMLTPVLAKLPTS